MTASLTEMENVKRDINNLVTEQDLTIALNEMNSGLERRLTELVSYIEVSYINPMAVDINSINTRLNIMDIEIKDVNDLLNATTSRQDLNMMGMA